MNFSTDRDLLVIEPNVFRDVPLVGQQRLKVADGIITGTVLTSMSADFVGAQADAGGVVLIDGVPHEIINRVDANTLTVSLPRVGIADPVIPSGDDVGLEVIIRSYAPQAALVHDVLLRLIGVDPDDPNSDVTEDAVVSQDLMARLEALGTLERVYSASVVLVGDNQEAKKKAEDFGRRFNAACRASTVLLDTDGDGYADVRRGLGVIWYSRV